jgi:hypothetical protein
VLQYICWTCVLVCILPGSVWFMYMQLQILGLIYLSTIKIYVHMQRYILMYNLYLQQRYIWIQVVAHLSIDICIHNLYMQWHILKLLYLSTIGIYVHTQRNILIYNLYLQQRYIRILAVAQLNIDISVYNIDIGISDRDICILIY